MAKKENTTIDKIIDTAKKRVGGIVKVVRVGQPLMVKGEDKAPKAKGEEKDERT